MLRKYLLLPLLFAPSIAFANTGIPLLAYMSEWQILFFIPVVFVEAAVLYKIIAISYWRACFASFIANFVSTLLGIVVIIPTMLVDSMASWGTVSTILLIILLYPFYRLSVWSEFWVLKRKFSHPELKQAVIIGNRLSYFMLLVFLIANIVKGYIVNGYVVW